MSTSFIGRTAKLSAAVLAAVALTVALATSASAMVIYNNLPKKLPGNLPSIGFEATSTAQFGGLVGFSASHRGRKNPRVTFTLSNWACQSGGGESCVSGKKSSYTWPVTVNLYEVGAGNVPGALIASQTQTVTVPYRPSASAQCATEGHPGDWFDKRTSECFAGKLFKVAYQFTGVTLPNQAIIGVAYNTQSYGAEPTGVSGPENSLNVGILEEVLTPPATGTDPLPEDVYADSTDAEMYCGNSAATGSFGDTGACWDGYQPAFRVNAEK